MANIGKRRGVTALSIVLVVGIVTGLVFSAVVRHHARTGGGISALLRISSDAFDANPQMRGRTGVRDSLALTTGGYDAQYNYFAVFDPFVTRYAHAPDNYSHMMDAAPYRFGRIGHAWLTRALAGDHWQRYPETMVWTVVGGLVATAMLLACLAVAHGQSPWWGLGVLAVPGYWQSVQTTLPEPIAAALLLAGLLVLRSRHWVFAILPFACACLTRETSVLLVGAVAGGLFWTGARAKALVLLTGAVLPLVVWKWHVFTVLFPVWGWEGLTFSPGTFGVPFSWLPDLWSQWTAGLYYPETPAVARAAWAFSVLVVGVSGVAFVAAWMRPSPITIAAGLYGIVAVLLNYSQVWVHVGNAQRTSGELFLVVILAAATAQLPPSRSRAIALSMLLSSAVFVAFLAHDATEVRAALFLR